MTHTFEQDVANYSGGDRLTLSTGENDGLIVIGLTADDDTRACSLEIDEADAVIRGLQEAIARAKAKA